MPSGSVAGFPFIVFASETAGTSFFKRTRLRIEVTKLTRDFMRITDAGHLSGFVGNLDANEDGHVALSGDLLERYFAGQYPDKLFLTLVVMTPDNAHVEFVSNAFVVDFQ